MPATKLRQVPLDWVPLRIAMDWSPLSARYDVLDLETGRVVTIFDDLIRHLEGRSPRKLTAWQEEELPLTREVLADRAGRYVQIPVPEKDERYEAMLEFAGQPGISDRLRRELYGALEGRGAFRRFRALLNRASRLEERWGHFEDDWLNRWIGNWLRSVGIDPGSPKEELGG